MPYIKDAVNDPVASLESLVPATLAYANAVVAALSSSHPALANANAVVDGLSSIQDLTDTLRGVDTDIPPDLTKSGRSI